MTKRETVTKVKGLISDNEELFEEFFIDTATFSPNTSKKKQYLKSNLDEIIVKFMEKRTETYSQYEDFLIDFGEWIDTVKFPLQQPTSISTGPSNTPNSTPVTTPINPPTTTSVQAHQQQPQPYKYPHQQENHANINQKHMMTQRPNYYLPRTPIYEN